MARKVESWMGDDGKRYTTELDALRADVEYWKARAAHAERALKDEPGAPPGPTYSSYGSSGGGGHD
jgi:hypothetical protein